MKILTHDMGIFPYDDTKYKIIGVGGNPVSIPGKKIYAYDVPNYYGGDRKCDIYFVPSTVEVKKWTNSETFNNYKIQIELDMEKKAFEYTARLDYRLNYYRCKLENGDTLTTSENNDMIDKRNSRIQASEWIRSKTININSATTMSEIKDEYDLFLEKYLKKIQELENIL
jgi:hypothetical protein